MSLRKAGYIPVIAGITALTVGVGVLAPWGTPTAYAERYIDFATGEYDVWDGQTYTFDWYRSSSEVDGVATYTISSASDLAGLVVVTNNLSGSEYVDITANIEASDAEFIATVDSFEGDVINLACNIDLAGFDWMPISYPWGTANLTAEYEFTNTDGELVTYNAVSEIPDDLVDIWVGGSDGEPISTRYWEFPESELRFRDYMRCLTFDSTHTLSDTEFIIEDELEGLNRVSSDYTSALYCPSYLIGAADRAGREVIDSTGFAGGNMIPAWGADWTNYLDGASVSALRLNEVSYADGDIATPYTFKSIAGYTEYAGFQGTFDGADFKIKGLAPSTPWTTDAEERLHTYDPIGRGLFSLIATEGIVKNLNVQGSYEDEICSYSAILCAYNYGMVDNCYVDGTMSQALIEMLYPIAKDYAPDGQSEYLLSSAAGTVLPVGNSGFMTSQNYGTIQNCYTVGEVTQAFRAFGFMASTNYGVIKGSTNKGSLTATDINTDFFTSEWVSHSAAGDMQMPYDKSIYSVSLGSAYAPSASEASGVLPLEKHHFNAVLASITEGTPITLEFCSTFLLTPLVLSNSTQGNIHPDDTLWIAPQYRTEVAESIAGNVLYGNYIMALAGGIAAVNEGTIEDCINEGEVLPLANITDTESVNTVQESSGTVAIETDRAAYSYIRPHNQYGIFATSNTSATFASGIAAQNFGAIRDCTNNADLALPEEYFYADTLEMTSFDRDTNLNIIAATANDFYCSDIKYSGRYYPCGLRWWCTEENKNEGMPAGYTEMHSFDRNMPYPYFVGNTINPTYMTAGIAAQVFDAEISNSQSNGTATYNAIVTCVDSELSNLSFDGEANCDIRHVNNCDIDTVMSTSECLIGSTYQIGENICSVSNVSAGMISYFVEGEDATRLVMSNLYAFDNLTGSIDTATITDFVTEGAVTSSWGSVIESDYQQRNCESAVIENGVIRGEYISRGINNCTLRNLVVDSDTEFAVNTLNNFYTRDSELEGITFITLNSTHPTTLMDNHLILGNFIDSSLTDVRAFGMNIAMWMENCEVENLTTAGTTSEVFIDYLKNEKSVDYLYSFNNCVCTDMYLESDIQFEYEDFLETATIQHIPGVLKAVRDTNTFTRCVVATPDGATSFPNTNLTSGEDKTILSDAKLVYSDKAHENGALAYYLDKGYSEDRTYNFTVAENDTVIPADVISGDLAMALPDDAFNSVNETIALPAYTRAKVDATEPSYYAVSAPYAGAGVGEIKLSVVRGDNTWTTTASDGYFPETEIFVIPGETFTYEVIAAEGSGLKGITWTTKSGTTELMTEGTKLEDFKVTSSVAPSEDVIILGDWANVWTIEISDAHEDWLLLQTSAVAALPDSYVLINTSLIGSENALGGVYYYPYVLDANNDWVLDMSEKFYIDLNTAMFQMPNAPIMLFAEPLKTGAEITEFVLAGTKGVINGNTITVGLESTVDLTAIAPDVIEVSPNATISPTVDEVRDFSEPVKYTVTSESGTENVYTVIAVPTLDGFITRFELGGQLGVIDQDAKTIAVAVASTVDLTHIKPSIVYSGIDISPNPNFAMDFSGDPVVFTVTASDGTLNSYTVSVSIADADSWVGSFALDAEGTELEVVFDDAQDRVFVYYPYGLDVSSVKLTEFSHFGATSNMQVGDVLNLTQRNVLTLTTDYGDVQNYDVFAIERPNSAKMITRFVLYGHLGIIDEEAGTITVTIPAKYDVTNILPDAVAYRGEEVIGLETVKNFSEPVEYVVRAYDGTEKTYTVTVIQV